MTNPELDKDSTCAKIAQVQKKGQREVARKMSTPVHKDSLRPKVGISACLLGQKNAQPHVYPKDLNSLRILIPPDAFYRRFESIVTPIFNLIKKLKYQNQKLAQARDLLLPWLKCGDIEV